MKLTLANLKIIIIAFIVVSTLITISSNAQTTRVLFIGNSLTGVNNLPSQFELLAQSAGKLIYVEDATAGGATLQNHLNNSNTISKIQQGNWDYVVLQEQSQLPSWENDRSTMFYPYAKSLDSIINIYNPCGKTLFFLTYAHRNGDLGILQNGGTDTYWAMQQRLRDGYMEIADSLNAVVCPVGWAFRECRLQYPNIELYMSDFNHPTDTGTYLAACAFYSTIFQDSSIGKPYIGNMPLNKATILQTIATQIVMDSLTLWNIGPNTNTAPLAAFSYFDTLLKVHFVDSSINANSYYWNFGDGNASSVASPIHTYSTAGNYTVSLGVQNACGSNTSVKNIQVYANNNPPICDFTFIQNDLNVSFSDSSQNANAYYWDFGDGSNSALTNPSHIYQSAGSYTVKLIVDNNFGSDSLSKQVIITAQLPVANFNYSFTPNIYTVSFQDSSQYANNILWNFGDGDTSSQSNPIHTFPGDNTYNVKLVISNIWGADSISKQVVVSYNSIDNSLEEQIGIFPNPNNGTFYIDTKEQIDRIQIINKLGKVVFDKIQGNSMSNSIRTELPTGSYILRLYLDDNTVSKKVIIK